MKLHLSLRPKITLGTLLILLLCMIIAGSIFLSREQIRLHNEIEREGKSLATLVAKFCAAPIEKFSYYIVQEVARNVEDSPGIAFCEIYDTNGDSLVQVDTTIHGKAIIKKAKTTGDDILIITRPIINKGILLGEVEIGLELSSVQNKIQLYIFGLIISIFIILTLVAAALYLFLSHNFISPVVNLSEAVKNLGQGDFVETEEATRNDEIGSLARAFNTMSRNLKQLYHNLEKKVHERTADLKEANENLQQEILVRQKTESELKSAKEAAEKANQYKSNFVANISHEIRTPLNAIIGYAQILQTREGLNEQDKKAILAIDKSGGHLLGLINDILDISKIEAGRVELKPVNFDLCLLLRNVTSMFQLRCTEKSLTWQVVGIDISQVIPVFADAGKLRQVLINLLGNAVKFTEKGGVVLRITVNDDSCYRFCIEDSGQGVPDSAKGNIINPFNQVAGKRGQEGTGLGLSICQNFLKMMGSNLEILDNLPCGSRFCFTVTLPPGSHTSLPENTPRQIINGLAFESRITALIVDDDNLSRSMLSHLLNKAHIDTVEAGNGVEAMKILDSKLPDIIFLDRYMPEMDGLETIKAVKDRYADSAPPIIMITAAAFESENIANDIDIEGVLIKPIEIEQVFQCMSSVLNLTPILDESPTDIQEAEHTDNTLSPADLHISDELREKIKRAAEFGRISELKAIIHDLEHSDSASEILVSVLKNHLERYELLQIQQIISPVENPSSYEMP